MPKESKKFINPLLRPSQQEVEPKQEPPPKQEKSVSTGMLQTNRAQQSQQVVEQEEKPKPTPPEPPIQQASEPDTYRVPTNGSVARSRTARATKHIPEPEAANGQENGMPIPEQANNHAQTYEPQAETLRPQPNQKVIRPETPPYNTHVSPAVITESIVVEPQESSKPQETIDTDTEMDENGDYEPEVDFGNVTTKARRKKGEQAFEKTHVRFTVWVDKSLKQSFEDIAFQRDKPKTTLINEALEDLVRKYEAH